MKSFRQLVEEKQKSLAILFGRMNPPTKGHEENAEGLKSLAAKHNADHLVIASHSHDAKKNPLTPAQKLKHLKRSFPNTNITTSSKELPTILHHASEAHKKGYNHLIVAGGGDRVKEYHRLLNHYNGVEGRHGYYKFNKIEVKSTGERKAGVSGTDMRNHVQNNDYKSFKSGLSSHMQKNDKHAKELFHDVRKGMGLNESHHRGMAKAIFITGGPGSGKDTIIRDAIAESKIVEINTIQAYDFLADKQKLAEHTKDERRNAIKQRRPLIINGSANDIERIKYIKEELEDFGYETMMIFVDTTNEASAERNQKLSRMMVEDVRHEKWLKSQTNAKAFKESFDLFIKFDNTIDLDKADIFGITDFESEISELLETTKLFFDTTSKLFEESLDKKFVNIFEGVKMHHASNQKSTLKNLIKNRQDKKRHDNEIHNRSIERLRQSLRGEELNVENDNQSIQKTGIELIDKNRTPNRTDKCKHGRLLIDNNCPSCQLARITGKRDDIKYGDTPGNPGTYAFRTYEEKSPTLTKNPEPKEPNFQKDKEKLKKKDSTPKDPSKIMKVTGLGPEFSTRGSGTVYPMSGLGNVTYSEGTEMKSFTDFRKKVKEAIDDPGASDMGVSGGERGATNKEPMQSYKDDDRKIGIEIKKKKKK